MRGWSTLRARTTLLVAVVTGLTLVVGAVALVLTLRTQLTRSGDDVARTRVTDLLALAQSGNLPTTIENIDDEGLAQVVDDRGDVVASSGNLEGAPSIDAGAPGAEPVVREMDAPDDDEVERYRIWMASGPSPDGPVTAYVGTSLESVGEADRTLRGALLVGVPLALLLLAAGTWLVVGRALRRVDAIRAEVDEITDRELHRRVPVSTVDDEVGRLADTMNRMLDRLEVASHRQRSFVADASHDLQSPLAAQRAQLEVALTHPHGQDRESLLRDLLTGTTEMERLAHDLLFLAAADERRDQDGVPGPPHRLLDLDDIVLEEATRARSAAAVRIDTSAVSAAPVTGDRGELARLVRNLLDNAVAHAREQVVVGVAAGAEGVHLTVADDGPGIPDADRQRVFDRFYRGDAARSRRDGGSGLGLAIARTIAERHGGQLTLAPSGTGARFEVRLPPPGGGAH